MLLYQADIHCTQAQAHAGARTLFRHADNHTHSHDACIPPRPTPHTHIHVREQTLTHGNTPASQAAGGAGGPPAPGRSSGRGRRARRCRWRHTPPSTAPPPVRVVRQELMVRRVLGGQGQVWRRRAAKTGLKTMPFADTHGFVIGACQCHAHMHNIGWDAGSRSKGYQWLISWGGPGSRLQALSLVCGQPQRAPCRPRAFRGANKPTRLPAVRGRH